MKVQNEGLANTSIESIHGVKQAYLYLVVVLVNFPNEHFPTSSQKTMQSTFCGIEASTAHKQVSLQNSTPIFVFSACQHIIV